MQVAYLLVQEIMGLRSDHQTGIGNFYVWQFHPSGEPSYDKQDH